jgi:hypothetical protein
MTCLVIDGGTEAYYRTANMPSPTAVTVAGWFRFVNGFSDVRCPISIYSGAESKLTVQASNAYLKIAGGTAGTVAMPSDAWVYLAYIGAAGGLTGYAWDDTGTLIDTVTAAADSGSVTSIDIGNNYNSNENIAGKMAQVRVWDAVLDPTDLETELRSADVVRETNFNSGFKDSSTGCAPVFDPARNWTAVSTVSQDTGDTPPVSGGGGSSSIAAMQNYYSRLRA